MGSLGDTIGRLAAFRARMDGHQKIHTPDRLSELSSFGSNPGALRARTYIPESLAANAPLVVVLHGCTQTAASYDHGSGWSRLADRARFALLFPEQQRSNNANLCFNWFLPGDSRRDGGEALSIRQMIETLIAIHGIDRKRVFITGLSAGGAMTSVMLAAYPDLFAGGAIIAGLPYGCATGVPEAFERMRGHGGPSEPALQSLLRGASKHDGPWPTISIWHGTADHTVDPSNMAAILAQWRGVHEVSQTPSCAAIVDGYSRKVWRNARGREIIEVYSIAGMGHGAPLNAVGANGYGESGPFMLDVGISSTFHIAGFWDLAASSEARAASEERQGPVVFPSPALSCDALPAKSHRAAPNEQALGVRTPISSAPLVTGVRKVIEDALRAAGLMQ
jgi:poly(hydroxyalkanoate) depolymerase family esterase